MWHTWKYISDQTVRIIWCEAHERNRENGGAYICRNKKKKKVVDIWYYMKLRKN